MASNLATGNSSIVDSYVQECERFEQKADRSLARSDVIVLNGFGCGISVKQGSLVVKTGFTHTKSTSEKLQAQTLYRGVHDISRIILLGTSGNITLDAIKWCKDQSITISIIDNDGNLVQALACEENSNAALRRKQYTACLETIAYRLICRKARSQLATLRKYPDMTEQVK
jgi:CRISPR/Cas system-associated endonuclease Cas1